MKLYFFVLLVLFLSIENLLAQSDFRPGYIITNSKDTLFGEIDYRGDLLMSNYCRFRKNESEVEDKFYPSDISAYRFINSKYYISKEINNKKVFLEFLIQGEISIYFYKDAAHETYYLKKADNPIIEIPYKEKMIYGEYKTHKFETKKHIGILNYYMNDAPELKSMINGIKKPEHKILIKLAADYHNIVCEDEACIVYEKNSQK